jgi:hypothetical protein
MDPKRFKKPQESTSPFDKDDNPDRLRIPKHENSQQRSTSKNKNGLLSSYKSTANQLRKNFSTGNNKITLVGLQELTFNEDAPMTTKHRMSKGNGSFVIDTEAKDNSRILREERSASKNKKELIKPDSSSIYKIARAGGTGTPKGKSVVILKTDILKQIGQKGSLNNSIINKKPNGDIINKIDSTIKPKKDDSVIKIHHDINHNYNHNIHININHNNLLRSTNISPIESTLSGKESDISKRSIKSNNPYLASIYNRNKSNLSKTKLTEIQKQNNLVQKFKVLNDDKLKKLKAIKLSKHPDTSIDLTNCKVNDSPEKTGKPGDLRLKLRLDNSVSEEMFNKINTKDLLNTSGKKGDSGSLISEESIFSKKCKFYIHL